MEYYFEMTPLLYKPNWNIEDEILKLKEHVEFDNIFKTKFDETYKAEYGAPYDVVYNYGYKGTYEKWYEIMYEKIFDAAYEDAERRGMHLKYKSPLYKSVDECIKQIRIYGKGEFAKYDKGATFEIFDKDGNEIEVEDNIYGDDKVDKDGNLIKEDESETETPPVVNETPVETVPLPVINEEPVVNQPVVNQPVVEKKDTKKKRERKKK
jgi:hypothetical protein